MIRLTRRYRFAASHRLHSAAFSEAENRALYGKCNNPFGHGHNYVLEVGVRAPVDPETGRAADVELLDRLVREQVIEAFDRRNLNTEVAAFTRLVATTENLGREIFRRLAGNWDSVFEGPWPVLEIVRIAETKRNIFEVRQ
ncbi:MAG: 6-carboxytetrahydropterin synthase [Bryobacterales bacterium]|nr:6-carboxytetrahydropterin synthase [Bryobacterales bacterium]